MSYWIKNKYILFVNLGILKTKCQKKIIRQIYKKVSKILRFNVDKDHYYYKILLNFTIKNNNANKLVWF